VDGTLTPPGSLVNVEFQSFLLDFIDSYNVTIVGGSSYDMILEQLGSDICHNVDSVFACQGTQQYQKGERKFKLVVEWPLEMFEVLEDFLSNSDWEYIYGNNICDRDSMINFSVVGRDCPHEIRAKYSAWDKLRGERQSISNYINNIFLEFECTIGGETSVDSTPTGIGKHNILDHIVGDITFFGDRCDPGGNDYSLAKKLEENGQIVHKVTNWEDTEKILKEITHGIHCRFTR